MCGRHTTYLLPTFEKPLQTRVQAVLLIVLCGACVFFTVGRQFQVRCEQGMLLLWPVLA